MRLRFLGLLFVSPESASSSIGIGEFEAILLEGSEVAASTLGYKIEGKYIRISE
jgi:hypothetical protein